MTVRHIALWCVFMISPLVSGFNKNVKGIVNPNIETDQEVVLKCTQLYTIRLNWEFIIHSGWLFILMWYDEGWCAI